MRLLKLLLVFGCWLGALSAAQAQSKITGVALDSVTHEPLAFASVFLANTTLGATTTEKGEFEFPRVPKGTYDIVGSYVGYRLGKQTITVETTPLKLTISLAPTGNQLGEVVVQPEPNKPEEYRKFTELFLGGSTFSEQCHISNPNDVRVLRDDSTQELSARTKEFLQIDNDALGYRLKYYGLYFSFDPDAGSITYYGQPVFDELKPRDEAQRRLWAANRLTAYTGSFMHFLRCLYTNRLAAGSFLAQPHVSALHRPAASGPLRRSARPALPATHEHVGLFAHAISAAAAGVAPAAGRRRSGDSGRRLAAQPPRSGHWRLLGLRENRRVSALRLRAHGFARADTGAGTRPAAGTPALAASQARAVM